MCPVFVNKGLLKKYLALIFFPQSKEHLADSSPNETKWVCLGAAVEQAKCGWSIGFSTLKLEERVNIKQAMKRHYKKWWDRGVWWMMKKAAETGRQKAKEKVMLSHCTSYEQQVDEMKQQKLTDSYTVSPWHMSQ